MDSNLLLKSVVEELGKEPFNLSYNIASFGSLPPQKLLNVLKMILQDISPTYYENEEENSERNGSKTVELLRLLRYWPKHSDQERVREGIERVVPEVVWEIMYWLLSNREELKERGYLAQFLVKVTIPRDILLDEDLEKCYELYECEIEEFKATHKRLQEMKKERERRSVGELVGDLDKINHDIQCLGRKVDGLKNRVSEKGVCGDVIERARMIRKSREERLRLEGQLRGEEAREGERRGRYEILLTAFRDIVENNAKGTAEGLLQRAEEDAEVLQYIVYKRLPIKIKEAERTVWALTLTEQQPPESLADLDFNRFKLEEMHREIMFYESEIRSKDLDPSVNFARQQCKNKGVRKCELSEDLERMTEELGNMREAIYKKRQDAPSASEDEERYLQTEQGFRNYVKDMKVKAANYKARKHEIQQLQAEVGHLSTTKYILQGDLKSSQQNLEMVEEKLGIVGFTGVKDGLEDLSSKKSLVEHQKMESIYQMATLAKTLKDKVDSRQSELEPLVKEVQTRREALEELENHAKELQSVMNVEIGPINETISRLEQNLDQLQESCATDELEITKMSLEIPVMKTNLERAKDKSEISDLELPAPNPRVRTFREKLVAKIMESELIRESLKKESSDLDRIEEDELSQQKMWMDLQEILRLKFDIRQRKCESAGGGGDDQWNSVLI